MSFLGELLPFQPPAVEKMVDRKQVLVSYDCGLGKTCCAIAACEHLMDTGDITAPVLVLCLASLKYQWASEIEKFSDSRSVVIDGTKAKRHEQYERVHRFAEGDGVDYVIVNYEALVYDWDQIRALPIGAIVADEATAIKSFRSQRSKRLKTLSKKVPIRFALTGTPMENGKPEEIFSIMQFVDPTVLGHFKAFDLSYIVRNRYGWVERYRNLPTLRMQLSDAVVRKSQNDEDVAQFLPSQIHRAPIKVPMGRAVGLLYKQIVRDLLADLSTMSSSGTWDVTSHYGLGPSAGGLDGRGEIMSKVTALRMCAQHPKLVLDSVAKAEAGEGGSGYLKVLFAAHPDLRASLAKVKSHPKLDVTVQYTRDHLDTDDEAKAVIFTTYVGMVDIIAEALSAHGIGVRTYTGRMNAKEKEAAKVAFQTDPTVRVLISSDAGGYGVDLPQANLLINYDLPWSSGASVQRNARIRRASSRWPSITIQDVLVGGSIEERLHTMLTAKNAVAAAVVDGVGTNAEGGIDITLGTLKNFLTS